MDLLAYAMFFSSPFFGCFYSLCIESIQCMKVSIHFRWKENWGGSVLYSVIIHVLTSRYCTSFIFLLLLQKTAQNLLLFIIEEQTNHFIGNTTANTMIRLEAKNMIHLYSINFFTNINVQTHKYPLFNIFYSNIIDTLIKNYLK